jgi:multidrug efflux pump subunit AcrA (membrane-fusion protein)
MLAAKNKLCLIVFALLLAGCSTTVGARPAELEMIVPTPTVLNDEWNPGLEIRSTGKVVLTKEYNLSFPISGQILEVLVEEGDFVQAGDTIAQLDTTAILSEIAKAEGELAVAQAKLERAMAGPHESEITEAEIQVTAIAVKTPVSRAEATAQASDLAAAQAHLAYLLDLPLPEDVALAQAEVDQAQRTVDSAKAQLKLALIVAPADGTVVRILLNAHEYARAGETVVQMSDLGRLSIQTKLYDFEIVGVNVGNTATISFDALPGVNVEGTVYSILPDENDDQGGRYTVMIRLNEIPEGLRWGMTAKVDISQE